MTAYLRDTNKYHLWCWSNSMEEVFLQWNAFVKTNIFHQMLQGFLFRIFDEYHHKDNNWFYHLKTKVLFEAVLKLFPVVFSYDSAFLFFLAWIKKTCLCLGHSFCLAAVVRLAWSNPLMRALCLCLPVAYSSPHLTLAEQQKLFFLIEIFGLLLIHNFLTK